MFVTGNENFFVKGKLRKALKSYDEGIRLLPYDQGLYLMRGLCRYELGYVEGARQDWIRCKDLGGGDMNSTLANYDVEQLKGYEELYTMFIKTK